MREQNILEGTLVMDVSEVSPSDTIPYLAKAVEAERQNRRHNGMQDFGVKWESLYIEDETAYVDCYLICSCGKPVDMKDLEQVEVGRCGNCL